MSNNSNLYRFLKLTRGTWRNAFYIECPVCSYKKSDCYGYLLTVNEKGTPLILSVPHFEAMTGDKVDKFECAAIITKEAFESLFHCWLKWNITNPKECSILQIISESDNRTP